MSKLRAAVIGSGFGGLAAAIRVQSMGFQTVLFEQRDKPGGRAYVYEQDGFIFDAGPTVITAPQCLSELFTLAGKRMEDYVNLIEVHPFYRLFWEDGDVFDYDNDHDFLIKQITERCPEDATGYQQFMEYAEQVYVEGYEKLGHVPFLKFWDMVKVAPQLLRLKAHRSVYNTVSQYIRDEKTRQALTFNSLLIGGNPFEVSSIYTLIHPLEKKFGVHFPKGGTHSMVRALAKLFQDIGGEMMLNSPIERIVTQGNKVVGVKRLAAEEIEPFNLVISNADIHHTYAKLLSENTHAQRTTKQLERKKYSMSLFVIYFGTTKRFPSLTHHNVMFGPRYKELLRDIFDHGVLADDFSLYVHAPCESDSSLAPDGHHSFYALAPVPNLEKCKVDWNTEGERYGDRILNYLESRYMPGLRQSLVHKKIFTPLDFHSELQAYQGSAFSLTPTLDQSAFFRGKNRDPNISGLYFVGAGTHPGAGIPGVVGSAKATSSVIQSDFVGIQ